MDLNEASGAIGRPLPGVEVKIVDPETFEELPPDTPGELCTRGYMQFLGTFSQWPWRYFMFTFLKYNVYVKGMLTMMQKLKKVCSLMVGGALETLPCWTQSMMYTV